MPARAVGSIKRKADLCRPDIGLDAKQLGNLDQNNYSASAEFQERGGQNHVIRMIGSSTQAILLVRSTEQLS
jgi:hypothetical protein